MDEQPKMRFEVFMTGPSDHLVFLLSARAQVSRREEDRAGGKSGESKKVAYRLVSSQGKRLDHQQRRCHGAKRLFSRIK